jgi:hypothetical protein
MDLMNLKAMGIIDKILAGQSVRQGFMQHATIKQRKEL